MPISFGQVKLYIVWPTIYVKYINIHNTKYIYCKKLVHDGSNNIELVLQMLIYFMYYLIILCSLTLTKTNS
jgi:hypothetical protein